MSVMRFLVAPDKFRGSLTAAQAAEIMAEAIAQVLPKAEVDLAPLADGGEGTIEALGSTPESQLVTTSGVTDPLGRDMNAHYLLMDSGRTAVIETAVASGYAQLEPHEKDPTRTSTQGTGILIGRALDDAVERILIGLGGSSTNDGGTGMASALGYRFLDRHGHELPPGGAALQYLDRIDVQNRHPMLDQVSIEVACDVTNPLCGPEGASAIYGPQKGATPEQVDQLDAALARLAEVIHRDLGLDVAQIPGAGAAGGLGAGVIAFLHAKLHRGIDLIIDHVKLQDRIQGVDLCLTGEGKLDRSSLAGKTVAGVADLARTADVPCIAIAGVVELDSSEIRKSGLTSALSLANGPLALEESLARAPELLAFTTEQVLLTWMNRNMAKNNS